MKTPCGLTTKVKKGKNKEKSKLKCETRREERKESGKLFACNNCPIVPRSENGRGQSFSSLVAAKTANLKESGNKISQAA